MKFNVKTDLSKIRAKVPQAVEYADHVTAVQAAADTEQFVPALTLSMSNRTRVDGGTITYEGPYASYLYNGKLMVDPSTGSAWASKGATKVLTNRNLVFTQTVHRQAQSHWFDVSKALNLDKWARVYGKAVKKELGK